MRKGKDMRRTKKLKNRKETKKERTSLMQCFLTFMELNEDEDFYLDEDYYLDEDEFSENKKEKNTYKEKIFVILILCAIFTIGYFGGSYLRYEEGYRDGYKKGYGKGVRLGYEAAYPENYKSAYYDGFLDGCSKSVTEGIDLKTKIISAYNSLLMCENIQEEYIREFTRRIEELMARPVPSEDDVDKFINDINEILSYT